MWKEQRAKGRCGHLVWKEKAGEALKVVGCAGLSKTCIKFL